MHNNPEIKAITKYPIFKDTKQDATKIQGKYMHGTPIV